MYDEDEDRPHPTVAAVLAELAAAAAEDSATAENADAALSWMLVAGGPEALTQEQVQLFCWYQLPYKWACSLPERFEVLEALARALELLDLPRYAAICRSPVTRGVVEAFEVSYAKGMAASKKADKASGLRPPDLEEFAWGSYFGIVESNAYSEVSAFLELAVASGELTPGARGFKAAQQRLETTFLTAPRGDSKSLIEQVRSERLQTWFRDLRSPLRRELFAAIEGEVRTPVGMPEGWTLPPRMHWLLEQIGDGEALTKTGNFNRSFVQRAAPLFGWGDERLPQSEDEITELWVTHEFIERCRLTRRSGTKLLPSPRGRRCLADAGKAWRTVSRELLAIGPFPAAAGEVLLAAMAGGETNHSRLRSLVITAILQEGFHDANGKPPADRHIASAMHETLNLLRSLELYDESGDWKDRRYVLTEAGRSITMEALWWRATGPKFGL